MREEKPSECDCCQFETGELKSFEQRDYKEGTTDLAWLCTLCSKTFASNAKMYPDQYKGQTETMSAICFVGNTLLKAVARLGVRNADAPEEQHQGSEAPATGTGGGTGTGSLVQGEQGYGAQPPKASQVVKKKEPALDSYFFLGDGVYGIRTEAGIQLITHDGMYTTNTIDIDDDTWANLLFWRGMAR